MSACEKLSEMFTLQYDSWRHVNHIFALHNKYVNIVHCTK